MKPVLVLGAGIAGLTSAYELERHGVPVMVAEASPAVAGMAASHRDADGFSYDVGVHFVTNRFAAAIGIGASCRVVPRYGEIVRLGRKRYRRYPLGLMTVPSFVASAVREKFRRAPAAASAADWFRHAYGRALAEEIALPLLVAWSGEPAETLSFRVADKFPMSVPHLLWLRAAQRLTRRAVAIGYCREEPQRAAVFHVYPESGVAGMCEALAERLQRPVLTNAPAARIFVEGERVVGAEVTGRRIEADTIVSTLPIHRLPALIEGSDRLERFARFRFRALVLVNLKLRGRGLLPDVVVWTPKDHPFFRVTEAPLSMPWLAPEGSTIVLCEIGSRIGDASWTAPDDELVELCLDNLGELVEGVRGRLLGARVLRAPLGYPVFSLEYEPDRLALLREGTGVAGLHSIGRNGSFEHILMEDIYWRTRRLVERMSAGLDSRPG